MISVIICSTNTGLLEKLRLNIAASIGTDYEILAFDNRVEKKGISAVYNQLAQKASYEIYCFIHEDVVIHSNEWGKELVNLLAQKEIGLVGISGAVYKSKYSGTWSTSDPSLYRTHSIQHFGHLSEPEITMVNPDNAEFSSVVIIDGVFMATRKEVFNQYSFDEQLLKGFHGYDIDYSMQVAQQYKLVVTYNLLLEHLSEGKLSSTWLQSSLKVHAKWRRFLPANCVGITESIKKLSDFKSCTCVLGAALQYPGNRNLVLKCFFNLLFKFYEYNKFRYSKLVVRYLLNKS